MCLDRVVLTALMICGLSSFEEAVAAPPSSRKVAALGRIEPAGGVVAIAAPPGERIERIEKAVGSWVEAGDELVILSGQQARQRQVELARTQRDEARTRAEANLHAARALHEEALLGLEAAESADIELPAQEARAEAARLSLETARAELERLSGLEPRLVPAQALERRRLLVRQAEIEANTQRLLLERLGAATALRRRSAEAKLRSAVANVDLAESTARLDSLDKAVELAEVTLELGRVCAPGRARIVEIVGRVGEVTGLRPILRLADTDHMQVVAEVYETDIRRVSPGQDVRVYSEALTGGRSGFLGGKVATIGTVVGANEVQAIGLPPTAEQRVVKVWIDLDEAGRAASLINLQVDVEFVPVGDAADTSRVSSP